MGRWRPPQARGSKYITQAGADRLQAELVHLWKVERPTVTATVHEAAKNGDRSENGDYIYGKRRLAEIDRRVRYLNKRLDELTVVSDLPRNREKVFFGAHVTIEEIPSSTNNNSNKILQYQIVGPDEFDLKESKISMDSPLAKALLGKQIDDEVVIKTPEGENVFEIRKIDYKY